MFDRKNARRSQQVRQVAKIKILVLIDWGNVSKCSALDSAPGRFNINAGFVRWMKQLRDIGEVVAVFIISPPHLISSHGLAFIDQGFFVIESYQVPIKHSGGTKDNSDELLIRLGTRLIDIIPDLTDIAIGSGDKDFTTFAMDAIRKGLRIILLPGTSSASLSPELRALCDTNPANKELMLFPFNTNSQ